MFKIADKLSGMRNDIDIDINFADVIVNEKRKLFYEDKHEIDYYKNSMCFSVCGALQNVNSCIKEEHNCCELKKHLSNLFLDGLCIILSYNANSRNEVLEDSLMLFTKSFIDNKHTDSSKNIALLEKNIRAIGVMKEVESIDNMFIVIAASFIEIGVSLKDAIKSIATHIVLDKLGLDETDIRYTDVCNTADKILFYNIKDFIEKLENNLLKK